MRLLAFSLAFLAPGLASAQYRPVDPVSELSSSTLSDLISSQQPAVERCASRNDTGAYVADVQASVRPGARPSTLYNANISISVRSRPRDGEFESCVQRAIRDALRHEAYAVARGVRTQQTFRVTERPEPPPEARRVPYSQGEATRVLSGSQSSFQECLELAGVPESLTLHVAVERDGRLVLINANIPSGSSPRALGCLTSAVGRLRVQGRPDRRVSLTHTIGVRGHAR